MPELTLFLESLTENRRRAVFLRLEPLTPTDLPPLRAAMASLAAAGGLSASTEALEAIAPRLSHTALHQLGSAIEIVHGAIEEAFSVARRANDRGLRRLLRLPHRQRRGDEPVPRPRLGGGRLHAGAGGEVPRRRPWRSRPRRADGSSRGARRPVRTSGLLKMTQRLFPSLPLGDGESPGRASLAIGAPPPRPESARLRTDLGVPPNRFVTGDPSALGHFADLAGVSPVALAANALVCVDDGWISAASA